MRWALAAILAFSSHSATAGEGAWVAFFREDNRSMAFERASIGDDRVNLLSVQPKVIYSGLVMDWEIKSQIHQFDCQKRTYRLLTKKIFDRSGKLTGDETAVVTSMNNAFKDRAHPLDTEALRKAHAMVCEKAEPAPAKPFSSLNEALAWMAN